MTTNFFNQANNISIEAIGSVSEGCYHKVTIEGVGKILGDIKFDKLEVEGTCKALGNLEGNVMDVEGVFTGKGDVKVKRLDVEGVMKTEKQKIYADEIVIEGILNNDDEVNADRIEVEGCINFNDLFGDEITINYSNRFLSFMGFGSFGKSLQTKMNRANNIECTVLKACNITCHSISATDIYLESHCVVDTISCNGTLHYDSTCVIRHIEGECERVIS
ncbi:hypothetical protein [[Eubacterium] hominis]|uniref:hypothetical protein n=1 Tax=[Eubacterium] hominis TaxID=2764325 RepID=UPI003A4D868D